MLSKHKRPDVSGIAPRTIQSSVLPNLLALGQPVAGTWSLARREGLTLIDALLFSGEQPFNTLHKLPTDPKQDLRPNLHLAAFHRGEKFWLMPMRWEAPTEAAYRLAQFPPLTHRVSESRNPRIEHLLFLAPLHSLARLPRRAFPVTPDS
jgi:hypothetical protein